MFRMLIFARRLPHLSVQQFRDIYESSHVALVNDLVREGVHVPMTSYRRHYLLRDHPMSTPGADLDFDVVVESAFDSEDGFKTTMANIQANPSLAALVTEDFDKFLDRASMRYIVVETREGGGEAAHIRQA